MRPDQVRPSTPPLSEVGVIALVPDRWSEQWQPRHQVLTRLARYFPVVWVNPAPEWRDAWRHPRGLDVPAEPRPGLEIHSPDLLLPLFYRPAWLAQGTARLRLAWARRRLVRAGCRRIVLYLWRPEFAWALGSVRYDLSCYHIDDEYTFNTVETPIPERELALLRSVDQVFIHSPALLEKKGGINPFTSFVPNGVDYAEHATPAPEPDDLRGVPHPRIGYTGRLKKQLDWPLLGTLVSRHPSWSFVFVGDIAHPELEAPIERLGREPNVFVLGEKSAHELTRYPQHFDVCLMPYRQDAYTRYIYPLKLHEYLAGGRPTVGTPIRSLEAFRSVVELAEGPDAWSAAIERALAEDDPERIRERQAVAREHDWETLVHRIAQQMAERLGPELADRVRAAGSAAGAEVALAAAGRP